MAVPAESNPAANAMRASMLSTIVSGFYVTWVFYIYFAFRVGIPLVLWLLGLVWDLITTIFAAFWSIITNYRFLIAFAIFFTALYFIHKYWPEFVYGLEKYIMPALDIMYNDVLRFLWNTLILTIANLLIYVWDACVQLIGFFIYFAVNVIVTIAYLVVEILGEINLGSFIEEIMKILTQLVELVVAFLQVLIKVGVVILKIVKPIFIALLKLWIQYIKILFKVVFWLMVPLFKAFFFYIKAIITVVKFVLGAFIHKKASRSARSLLEVNTPLKNAFKKGPASVDANDMLYDQASKLNIYEAFTGSLRYYSLGQYAGFVSSMDEVHMGIRQYDHIGADGEVDHGGWDGSGGDLEHHLYEEDELEEHEKPFGMRAAAAKRRQEAKLAAIKKYRERNPRSALDQAIVDSKYSTAGKRKLNELLSNEDIVTRLQTIFGSDDPEEAEMETLDKEFIEQDIDFAEDDASDSDESIECSVDRLVATDALLKRYHSIEEAIVAGCTFINDKNPEMAVDEEEIEGPLDECHNPGYSDGTTCKPDERDEPEEGTNDGGDGKTEPDPNTIGNHWRSDETIEERHKRWRSNPDDWWRIDLTHNMTSKQVFPHLGRKLRRAQLHKLFKPHTPEEHLHVRKVFAAYRHGIEHAMYRATKRHIHSGHFHRALGKSWKHLTGHEELTPWIHEKFGPPGNRTYASVGHWLHSVIPDFTNDIGIFRKLKEWDPESKTRLYHHDWVRSVCPSCKDGVLPREVYEHLEAQERWNEEQDYLNSGNGEPSSPLPDCDGPTMTGDKYCMYGKTRVRRVTLPTGRKLHIKAAFEPFGINLEFLYENDCFTTKTRNILCIPTLPKNFLLPYLDFKSVIFVSDLNNNTACEPTWKSTACFICWDGVYNAFVELRFSIYFLDIIWRILILGIFLPDPSEWLGYLGKVFPPLSPFINWFLLYPVGSTPPGQAFACFFINLIYLAELIAVLLFAYYILSPLWSFARRQYTALYLLIIGFKAQLALRMDYMIQTNESILMNIKRTTRDAYRKQLADSSRSQALISSSLGERARSGGDPERDAAEIYTQEQTAASPSGNSRRITSDMLRKLSHDDPRSANAIIDLQSQIEKKRTLIARQLMDLGERIGVTPESIYRDAYKPSKTARFMGPDNARKMQQRWQRITELIQVPVEYTPSFASARVKAEDRRQKTKHNTEISGRFPGGDME